MNANHAKLCSSPQWAEFLHTEVLPAVTGGIDLGHEMLEIGPGPGAATDWLALRVARLVAVEYDRRAADALAIKWDGGNVEVVCGDASQLAFEDGSFDSAGCYTMLHHVPTVALQDAVLSEAFRVLRPGGVLVGSDSLASDELERFHEEDTYNPIEPDTLPARLHSLGFEQITVDVDPILSFVAHKPRTASM